MMHNLAICYDTQKCHKIVIDHEWIILSYDTCNEFYPKVL